MTLFIDQSTLKYPIDLATLRSLHPNTSFSENTPDQTYLDFGCRVVAPTMRPEPPTGKVVVEDAPTFVNGSWTQVWVFKDAPAPTVPPSCTNFQMRAVLLTMPSPTSGRTMFQDVDDALKANGGAEYQAWEFANDFTRAGALVNKMAASFGMTSAQMDTLFINASAISA